MAQLKDLIVNGVSRFLGKVNAGTIEATSFVKSGGTSSQFLKADGSVDSNSYVTTSALSGYLPLSGGTLSSSSANLFNINSTSGSNNYVYMKVGGANKVSLGYFSNFAFIANEATYARIGVNDSGVPQYWPSNSSSGAKTLIHEGNYSTYISTPGTLNTTATTAQSTSASEALSGSITLHKVAKTGTYSDLIGTPTIPTITLNGSSTTSASLYAPTTAGTSGQVLTSNGSGAPTWQAPSGPTPTTITLDKTYLRIPQPASSSNPCVLQIITNKGGHRILHLLEMGLPYDEPGGHFYMFGNSWTSPLCNGGVTTIYYAYNSTAGTGAYYFEISDTTATAEVTLLSGIMPSISTENSLVSGDSWLSDYDNSWSTVDRSPMSVKVDSTNNRFILIEDGTRIYVDYSTIVSGGGGEITSHKVTSLSSSSTTTQYPSAKTTYDEIHPAIGSSMPSGGFEPNKEYNLGSVTGTTTFSIKTSNIDTNVSNYYFWTFSTSSTAPTITWPSGLTWQGGSAPTIAASKYYEILVRKSGSSYYATYLEF